MRKILEEAPASPPESPLRGAANALLGRAVSMRAGGGSGGGALGPPYFAPDSVRFPA
jgi:hypothetical protein